MPTAAKTYYKSAHRSLNSLVRSTQSQKIEIELIVRIQANDAERRKVSMDARHVRYAIAVGIASGSKRREGRGVLEFPRVGNTISIN
jgi:hypothetical protein